MKEDSGLDEFNSTDEYSLNKRTDNDQNQIDGNCKWNISTEYWTTFNDFKIKFHWMHFNKYFLWISMSTAGDPPSKIPKIDVKLVQRHVRFGEYSLRRREGEQFNRKDSYWETFWEICDANLVQVRGFVACSVCKRAYVYETKKNGTKSIRHHWERCKPGSTIDGFLQKRKADFSNAEKKTVLEAAVKFCCKDLRPFYALYGEGAMDFTEAVVHVCSAHGVVSRESLETLLPCPNSVRFFFLHLNQLFLFL